MAVKDVFVDRGYKGIKHIKQCHSCILNQIKKYLRSKTQSIVEELP
jgi:hypothetical protein